MYLFIWKAEKERERQSICLLIPQLHAANRQGWARPKPEAGFSKQVSRMDGKEPSTWQLEPSSAALSRKLESGREPRLKPRHLTWDVGVASRVLTTMPNAYPWWWNVKVVFDLLIHLVLILFEKNWERKRETERLRDTSGSYLQIPQYPGLD